MIERYFAEDVEGSNDDIVIQIKNELKLIYAEHEIMVACKMIKDSFVDITDKKGVQVYKDKKCVLLQLLMPLQITSISMM